MRELDNELTQRLMIDLNQRLAVLEATVSVLLAACAKADIKIDTDLYALIMSHKLGAPLDEDSFSTKKA